MFCYRLQDWRCLWCRATVHTQCRPKMLPGCPLGPARVSVVPPTALHSIQDEAWEAVRPQASSPLLVFVNSKSGTSNFPTQWKQNLSTLLFFVFCFVGDNQGVKFLRRFKQLLNPAQVFDLISTGPRLGLRLFRHFDPFRILVCSGDGSVGWVLSEIDKLDMHVSYSNTKNVPDDLASFIPIPIQQPTISLKRNGQDMSFLSL